ncbi:DNA translocase FtsK [Candidatus Kaiserbacteria bacterium]|nr:DNA translocase FtsK [Candidatus Kaiserbacteria bacterium]
MKRVERTKKKTKRRARRDEDQDDISDTQKGAVSSGALRSVAAVFFVAIAIFFLIAEIGFGGPAGNMVYSALKWLVGAVGYPLLPLSFTLLAVILFRSFEKHFGWVQIASMFVFLLSALGLINVAFPTYAGVLGSVSDPLIAAMRTPATVIFLFAFIVASLVIAFDINLGALAGRIRDMFAGSEDDEFGMTVAAPLPETTPTIVAPMAQEETPEENQGKKSVREAVISTFNSKKNDTEDFAPIAATGSTYVPPPLSILAKNKGKPEVGDVKANMNIIKRTLQNFGIQVEMDEATIGPTVTRYSMKPAEGVRLSKILALQSNLELALAVSPVRIEAPIPGKSLVGIEVPNIARTTLGLAPLVSDEAYVGSPKPLLMALGRTITGQAQYADLAKMPHLLVAGTTGAGKSVTIHDFIVSLLYRCGPERLRFIMVDPKRVELTLYNSIPHLLTPVITDAKKAILALKWLAKEMDRRYDVLQREKVRDISSYHENVLVPALAKAETGELDEDEDLPEAMPYIVLIIDELADIMQAYPRELESGIVRLAQMSRAVGIHLILSTQRPSVKVITGLIKANIPGRVALQVASQIDSRTILDMGGAEKLLGAGDILFLSGDMSKPVRIQAPYITEDETKKVVAYLARQAEGHLPSEIDFSDAGKTGGGMDPIFSSMVGGGDDDEGDELYGEAKRTVLEAGKASTSYLQRKLGVGYARAAKLMDILEDRGVIGPADGAKPRAIIGEGNADELARASQDENEALEDTE